MIPGFYYFPNVLSADLQESIGSFLDDPTRVWPSVSESANARKVMQFGFGYSYKHKDLVKADPFPDLILQLRDMIRGLDVVPDLPLNQCLINRYLPSQGISAHTDSLTFMDFICCYTVGSGAEMEFTKGDSVVKVYVEPGSLYIMSGECRYDWKHEMRARKSDRVNGKSVVREVRTSITFRSV